jgi:hypothetical protein
MWKYLLRRHHAQGDKMCMKRLSVAVSGAMVGGNAHDGSTRRYRMTIRCCEPLSLD